MTPEIPIHINTTETKIRSVKPSYGPDKVTRKTISKIIERIPLSNENLGQFLTWLTFSPARVIAGGGTWMFTGYVLYLVVGVVGVAVTSMFYFYIEGLLGKTLHGLTNLLTLEGSMNSS